MGKRMLIDAAHPEETRVVVLSGNRLEEFDFESSTKKQVKGNIYLAKVTRVEPSLQAAFVDYGGDRHGFLAFSEIHPDYYRIPVSDRESTDRDHGGREAGENDGRPAEAASPAEASEASPEPDGETPASSEATQTYEEFPALAVALPEAAPIRVEGESPVESPAVVAPVDEPVAEESLGAVHEVEMAAPIEAVVSTETFLE
jgi:ribonuclease E